MRTTRTLISQLYNSFNIYSQNVCQFKGTYIYSRFDLYDSFGATWIPYFNQAILSTRQYFRSAAVFYTTNRVNGIYSTRMCLCYRINTAIQSINISASQMKISIKKSNQRFERYTTTTYMIWSEPPKSPMARYECFVRDNPNAAHLNVSFLLISRTTSIWLPFISYTLISPVPFARPPIATNFAVCGIHFVSSTEKFSTCLIWQNINGCSISIGSSFVWQICQCTYGDSTAASVVLRIINEFSCFASIREKQLGKYFYVVLICLRQWHEQ